MTDIPVGSRVDYVVRKGEQPAQGFVVEQVAWASLLPPDRGKKTVIGYMVGPFPWTQPNTPDCLFITFSQVSLRSDE